MRTFDELEALWQAAPAAPRDAGTLRHLVLRKGGGVHEVVDQVRLEREAGIIGDRWADSPTPDPGCQVTLMDVRVAEWVAHDAAPIDAPGDNLLVEFDLSEAALPVGTRLSVGEAVLEISAVPHLGCATFSERFGPGALRWVNWKPFRPRRLRGVNCRIVQGGVVCAGDRIAALPARAAAESPER